LTQYAAGGTLHVIPAHGSPLHAPDSQPFAHVVVVDVYEHTPVVHVPEGEYVLSVMPSTHDRGGGLMQTTLLHGSFPVHAPFAHVSKQTTWYST
jgi:hypothetical protein